LDGRKRKSLRLERVRERRKHEHSEGRWEREREPVRPFSDLRGVKYRIALSPSALGPNPSQVSTSVVPFAALAWS
jgi:hypothetical protein